MKQYPYNGLTFTLRPFTNVDPDSYGIEIWLDNELVGSINSISIPDENDADECEAFNKTVETFLNHYY